MGKNTLIAENLCEVMTVFSHALADNKEALNRLNVYPVPDGDTGTNMSLTLSSVVSRLDELREQDLGLEMESVCKAISQGSLMGARGNSGVILSQLLRGFTDTIRTSYEIGPEQIAQALVRASESAYEAVLRPVEGTILTVANGAGEGAKQSSESGGDLEAVVNSALSQAKIALENTPKLLPVLAKAGVVDAGGSGYVLFLHALANVVSGVPVPKSAQMNDAASQMAGPIDISTPPTFHDDCSSADNIADLRYEVMYMLEASDELIGGFKELWGSLGDSIVVVGGDGLWNCHIHTDDVGGAIEAALDVGRPRQIRVTDLIDQVGKIEEIEEERWVREGASVSYETHSFQEGTKVGDKGPLTAVVCVSNGDGIRRIFSSLGVHAIINGGQSMNPSTQDVLDAIEKVPASQVLVLPNNSNIVPVANQASQLSSKEVVVLPTRSIPQAFEALMIYDPDASVQTNFKAMEEILDSAIFGEVTRAVRDADTEIGKVLAGQWIGLDSKGIRIVRDELALASCSLLDLLVDESAEVVTIIEGDGSSTADTRHITVWLSDNRPDAEIEIHHGGQPLYPYLFGIG